MSNHWESFENYSSWRKISAGMWGTPADPTIYGFETLDASRLVSYLDDVSRASGTRVGVAAYCAGVIAKTLQRHPELNVTMVGKKVMRRTSNDVFCQVAVGNDDAGEADLSGVKLSGAGQMDLVEIAQRLDSRAADVRAGQDEEMEKTKSMVDVVPSWMMRPMLKMVDFLTYNVPFDLDQIGIRSDPFGSAMVTSVGQFGIKQGFAPLVPASRVPIVLLPGVIHKAPFVTEDGGVEARDALILSCTFDHRCYDGYQIGQLSKSIRQLVVHPTDHFPEPQHWAEPVPETSPSQRPDVPGTPPAAAE